MDVLKIDVEGAEGKALRGMLELIERHRPVVFSEFTPSALPLMSGISPAEYLEMFTSRGYSLAVLTGDGPSRMAAQQLLEHTTIVAPDSHVDFLAEPLP
jgi:hypothetical protein